MIGDLFSAGFAWTDDVDVSQPVATASATPTHVLERDEGTGFVWGDEVVSQRGATPSATTMPSSHSSATGRDAGVGNATVATVASVAETEGQRLERLLSQPIVAVRATPVATPETADFRGVVDGAHVGVATVATVAGWIDGVASLNDRRVPPGIERREWVALVRDSQTLMQLWGHDLRRAGWSACDVFGVEPSMTHRRLDRLGLVSFLRGGDVEAIDSDTAAIRQGKDVMTFYRRLRGEGSVPIWTVSGGTLE